MRHQRRKGVVLERRWHIAYPHREDDVGHDARHYKTTPAWSPRRSTPARGPLHYRPELCQGRSGARAAAATLAANEQDSQLVIGASPDIHAAIIVNERETERRRINAVIHRSGEDRRIVSSWRAVENRDTLADRPIGFCHGPILPPLVRALSGRAAYAFGEQVEIRLGSSEGGAARIDGPAHIRIIWLAREQV